MSKIVLLVDADAAVRAALKFATRSGLTGVLEKPLSDAALVENIRGALAVPA